MSSFRFLKSLNYIINIMNDIALVYSSFNNIFLTFSYFIIFSRSSFNSRFQIDIIVRCIYIGVHSNINYLKIIIFDFWGLHEILSISLCYIIMSISYFRSQYPYFIFLSEFIRKKILENKTNFSYIYLYFKYIFLMKKVL